MISHEWGLTLQTWLRFWFLLLRTIKGNNNNNQLAGMQPLNSVIELSAEASIQVSPVLAGRQASGQAGNQTSNRLLQYIEAKP